MVAEGFLVSVANFLGLPLNAKRRAANSLNKKSLEDDIPSSVRELVDTIISITADDICIGEAPLFSTHNKRIGSELRQKVTNLTEELNSIVLWVAKDLLKVGYSLYSITIDEAKNKITLFPYIEAVDFYLDSNKELIIVNQETGVRLNDMLCFIYYEKENLHKQETVIDGISKDNLKVVPTGIQMKNVKKSAQDLAVIEKALQRLRSQYRIVRFAEVEVGVNKGSNQQDVLDDVAQGLNANSIDLQSNEYFDDQIPVFPTRKGIGSVEMKEHTPNMNLGHTEDLDYTLSKFFMGMRFPKNYADFTQNLGDTAVSLIRSDLRYAKLRNRVAAVIENTINRFVTGIPTLSAIHLRYKLTSMPNSETDELVNALSVFTEFSQTVWEFLISNESNEETAKALLSAVKTLFASSTNVKAVEAWIKKMEYALECHFGNVEEQQQQIEGMDDDFSNSSSYIDTEDDEGNASTTDEQEQEVVEEDLSL